MDINQRTENMIQMFLKYGTKENLSVDEFLSLRKQVVDETLSGVKLEDTQSTTNKVIEQNQQLIDNSTTIEIPKIEPQVEHKVENKIINQSPQTKKENKATKINNTKKIEKQPIQENKVVELPNDEEEDENINDENNFSENEFLAMMRSIED
jgi:outer membrane biosynthesis protein TonB